MMPVNIRVLIRSYRARGSVKLLDGKCSMLSAFLSVLIRIAQISLNGEIFAEAMQLNGFHMRRLAYSEVPGSGCEGYRSCATQDFRTVIKEHFIYNPRSQGGPVDERATFD